jgi:hypothetical protein
VEIDQTVVNISTTLPLKKHRGYFRLTHRFSRNLGRGSFGSLAEDAFSLDEGAIIGLEFRYGITSRIQAGIHRSILGKTINVFGRWDAWQQTDGHPFSLSVMPSVEGQNNLRQDQQPGISATISRALGSRLVAYVSPSYVHNAHTETLRSQHAGHTPAPGEVDPALLSDAIDTGFIGLGTRARIRPTVSIVAEIWPRIGGYAPDTAAWNFGFEKETHGHVLQLNFGNNFDTTPGMIARGGFRDQVFMGFNLTRKF